MTMQDNIDILGRPLRRKMLQPETFLTAHKINNQRPIKIAVAISTHDGDARGNGAQFVQNSLRANIAQMPNFVRARSQIGNGWRQFVMRIGENEYAEHLRWRSGAMQNRSSIFHHANIHCFSQCSY